ncbi:hypothetical protein Bca4012_091405 [Brassica carinata]
MIRWQASFDLMPHPTIRCKQPRSKIDLVHLPLYKKRVISRVSLPLHLSRVSLPLHHTRVSLPLHHARVALPLHLSRVFPLHVSRDFPLHISRCPFSPLSFSHLSPFPLSPFTLRSSFPLSPLSPAFSRSTPQRSRFPLSPLSPALSRSSPQGTGGGAGGTTGGGGGAVVGGGGGGGAGGGCGSCNCIGVCQYKPSLIPRLDFGFNVAFNIIHRFGLWSVALAFLSELVTEKNVKHFAESMIRICDPSLV